MAEDHVTEIGGFQIEQTVVDLSAAQRLAYKAPKAANLQAGDRRPAHRARERRLCELYLAGRALQKYAEQSHVANCNATSRPTLANHQKVPQSASLVREPVHQTRRRLPPQYQP